MEIQLMNAFTGFEAGITHLQNPSFFSRLSQSLKIYSFWTYVALLLATVATFGSFLHRSMSTLLFKLKTQKPSISECFTPFQSDPDDDTSSISSESDDDDDDDEDKDDETTSTFETNSYLGDDADFRVSGSNKLHPDSNKDGKLEKMQGFCTEEEQEDWLSEGVVKLWNDWGFGFENSSGLISMLDSNTGEILMSLSGAAGRNPAITMPSPAVVVSAGVENMRSAAMRIWDTRASSRTPAAAVAEWQPLRRRVVGVQSGGVEKLFVREHGGSVVVRDMRIVALPLEELTESAGQPWLDADAVMVADGDVLGCDGESTEMGWGRSLKNSCARTRFFL